MDPHLPFLKAIAANPPDDLPRMVYADFLEETDEPVHVARAHFIRTQIALESLPPRTRDFREAKALERRLMEAFEFEWLFELPEYLQKQDRVTWRRGFPNSIRIGLGFPDDWGQVCPEWFERNPIQRVHIERMRDWGPGVANWTHRLRWDWVTHLRIGPGFSPLDQSGEQTLFAQELMTAPQFTFLRSLDLSDNIDLTDEWLVRFASHFSDTSFARTLEELDLSQCYEIDDAGANLLATARGLEQLKVLRLTGIPLSAASITMLRRRFGDGLVV
jgi:uncharacterized protein (TIGR02996 family)